MSQIIHIHKHNFVVPDSFINVTAICSYCVLFMENKQKSSPFSPDLCPCCHEKCLGNSFALCLECLKDINTDGFAESSWGSCLLLWNIVNIISLENYKLLFENKEWNGMLTLHNFETVLISEVFFWGQLLQSLEKL